MEEKEKEGLVTCFYSAHTPSILYFALNTQRITFIITIIILFIRLNDAHDINFIFRVFCHEEVSLPIHTARDLAVVFLATTIQKGAKKDTNACATSVIASPDPFLSLVSLPPLDNKYRLHHHLRILF